MNVLILAIRQLSRAMLLTCAFGVLWLVPDSSQAIDSGTLDNK